MTYDEMDEHELERALSAPGTATELAEQDKYVAMFRAAQPVPAPTVVVPMARRTARRVGTTAILAAAVAVATGGVAAAYSSNLPAPVQRAVHSVLAPLGVPQAKPAKEAPPATPQADPTPVAPSPTPAVPPHPRPSHSHPPRPSSTPSPSTVDPSASPTDGEPDRLAVRRPVDLGVAGALGHPDGLPDGRSHADDAPRARCPPPSRSRRREPDSRSRPAAPPSSPAS